MKLRRFIAILLCCALFVLAGTGCGEPDEPDNYEYNNGETPVDIDPEDDPPEHGHLHGIDYDAAFAAFAPDTVMIRVGDFIVTWEELYVFLFRSMSSIEQLLQSGADWDEVYAENKTLAEATLEYSADEVILFKVYEHGAKALGITLGADELAEYEADLEYLTEMYGGKEEFADALREYSGFYNFELFERLLKTEYLVSQIVLTLYGLDGDSFPDKDAAVIAEREGFMMAQHILRLKTEAGDDTPVKESEEILKQLNDYDGDEFMLFFSALMSEKSEDPGSFSFPQGYLFQHWDMVPQFSDACAALDIGQYSGVVETDYGYHIILRLPINYDAVPISLANTGQDRTLRQIAAIENFESVVIQGWRDEVTIEYTPEFRSINMATLFAWGEDS